MLYSSFPLVIYFTHSNVYISVLLSQFIPPSPSPTVWVGCVCVCVCERERKRERERVMWTIFKAFTEFVTMVFWPGDTWDETHIPCTERWSLNHRNTREIQIIAFYMQLYQHHFQMSSCPCELRKKDSGNLNTTTDTSLSYIIITQK